MFKASSTKRCKPPLIVPESTTRTALPNGSAARTALDYVPLSALESGMHNTSPPFCVSSSNTRANAKGAG